MIEKQQKSGKIARKNDTWTVRGVSHETRTAAKMAARRSGQTLGEWLEQNIRAAATDEVKRNLPMHRLEDQLAEISGKLDAMQRPFWRFWR